MSKRGRASAGSASGDGGKKIAAERDVSRILFARATGRGGPGRTVIHLGRPSPAGSCTLPAALRRPEDRHTRRAASRCLCGLAGGGVYPAAAVTSRAVRSYRTFSPLPTGNAKTQKRQNARTRNTVPRPSFRGFGFLRFCVSGRRYVFCGTFPRLAPGWRYQPPCPAQFGLSSRLYTSAKTSDRLARSAAILNSEFRIASAEWNASVRLRWDAAWPVPFSVRESRGRCSGRRPSRPSADSEVGRYKTVSPNTVLAASAILEFAAFHKIIPAQRARVHGPVLLFIQTFQQKDRCGPGFSRRAGSPGHRLSAWATHLAPAPRRLEHHPAQGVVRPPTAGATPGRTAQGVNNWTCPVVLRLPIPERGTGLWRALL